MQLDDVLQCCISSEPAYSLIICAAHCSYIPQVITRVCRAATESLLFMVHEKSHDATINK
jgi:hypothetical protein